MDFLDKSRPRVKNTRILRERIEKFISPIYFSDVNLHSKLYMHTKKIEKVYHYHAPGRITYDEAVSCAGQFEEVNIGQSYGPTWSTHWFRVDLDLSLDTNWKNKEVSLRWNSGTEAMVWQDGHPMQGLTGGDGQVRTDYILTPSCQGNEKFCVYIEMAANGMFGAGKGGMILPPDPDRSFTLSMLEVSVINRDVYGIIRDLKIIFDMVESLPEDDHLAHQALQIGCDVVNSCQTSSNSSRDEAKEILNKFFGRKDVVPNQYTIHAIGHCHIDTAWLWPYAETIRKCGRSWSSVVGLMKRYPQIKFACSSAVQFDWVKEKYPGLFAEIKQYVKSGQFVHTGGTWVEMDGNVPSGEAFVRQFLYGQRFFKKEFGAYCNVFWLPDTFGYSAQLPQIMNQSGIKYFLTQKISWSLINTFPHNSFLWQGIDGSKCLTHFPPADTYESSVTVKDVLKTRNKNKDRGIVSDGMLLYGFGDGGGGPTEDMIENISRIGNIIGFPSIQHSSPTEFFSILEKSSHLVHTWVGELYLELHQGTFTTQALVKKQNRKCEIQLRNTEFFQVWAYLVTHGAENRSESSAEIEKLWKKVLLNQFHDVLPGTSINEVYNDVWKLYEEVIDGCIHLNEKHKDVIAGECNSQGSQSNGIIFNTSAWPRKEIVLIDADQKLSENMEKQSICCLNGKTVTGVMVDVPSMSCCNVNNALYPDQVTIHHDTQLGMMVLNNKYLNARFNSSGQLEACILKDSERECISKISRGNNFCLFTDIPLYWDAWDVMPYNNETRVSLNACSGMEIINTGPLRVSFKFSLKISDVSFLNQIVSLDAESKYLRFDTEVNWNENRKMLKVEFPFNVHTQEATFEIQYGHLRRATHCNTSWDWAKHEVCGHKWVDVSEYGFGVALLNDCKYGFSVYNSTVQMSLLRSSKAPDGEADMGCHTFSYAMMPYIGSFQSAGVIQRAYDFNNQLDFMSSAKICPQMSLFQVNSPNVVLDTVKMCEEKEDSIIIRLYESFGSHVDVRLASLYQILDVFRTDALEDRLDSVDTRLSLIDSFTCGFSMKPFELLCLCVHFKREDDSHEFIRSN